MDYFAMTGQVDTKPKSHSEYAVGWICALPKEQTAATAMLDQKHPDLPLPPNDHNIYTLGSIGKHNVVIVCLPKGRYGTNSAATVATQMVRTFPSIKIGLMVGIGGGIPPKVRLGDVVVSTPVGGFPGVVQWDMGKTKDGSFERTGWLNNPPTSLLTALTKLETEHDLEGTKIPEFLDELKRKWPRLAPKYLKCDSFEDPWHAHDIHHKRSRWQVISTLWEMILILFTYLLGWRVFTPMNHEAKQVTSNASNTVGEEGRNKPEDIRVHYGLIASGNQVIKDATLRDKLDSEFGSHVLCVEMEAAGLMNNFPCIVIRGICDYADSHKNKEWQEYAATVAAAFTKELLEYVQPSDVDEERPVKEYLGQILDTVSRNEVDIKVVRSKLDKKEDRNILNWLTPIDYGPQQSDIFRRRQPGTGQWLLYSAEFQKWLSTSHQTLFCPGIPGAGKTILTSVVTNTLTDFYSQDPTVGIAYIYCNFQRKDEQNIDHLLASLLKQLAEGCLSLPESVKDIFNRNKAQKTRPSLEDILSTLHSIAAKYSRVFIIVDALDECQTSEGCRMKFLSEILRLQEKHGANIFATSRIDDDIGKTFSNAISLKIYARDNDIEMYLDERMRLQNSDIFDDTIKSTIKRDVVKGTGGMFLLAELHMNSLLSLPTRGHVKDALQNLAKGIEKLDETYEQAMKRIDDHGKESRDLAKRILAWIVYARRPLFTLELQHALAIRPHSLDLDEDYLPSINLLRSLCVGLVAIDDESGIIRLVHYTTQEYFQRTQQRWFLSGESEITRSCITYLSLNAFQSGPCDTYEEIEKRLRSYPLYYYAAQCWGHHAREALTLCPEVIEFLSCGMKLEASTQALMIPELSQWHIEHYYHSFPRGVTGLHLAAYFGIEEAVKTLLQKQAKPDASDSYDRTPLSYASQNGHSTITKLFLERGVDADSLGINGLTPLLLALLYGHTAIAEQLLATGRTNPDSKDNSGRTPLLIAARGGHKSIVGQLLATGRVNPDSKDNSGRTPLLVAARGGHSAIVEQLLTMGRVNPDSKDNRGGTPLSFSASNGHTAIVEHLLAAGRVDLNSKDRKGRTPLLLAAWAGHRSVVEQLVVTNRVNLDSKDFKFGQTSLSLAAENGHEAVVELLLEKGADLESKDSGFGQTSLSLAAENGHEAIVRLLLEKGADLECKDSKYGQTPLSLAAENGHEVVVKLLLGIGKAKPDVKDNCGRTPLFYATKYGYGSIVTAILTSSIVDPSQEDYYGSTLLSIAVRNSHAEVVKILLATELVACDSRDCLGRTVLWWAKRSGNAGIEKMIFDYAKKRGILLCGEENWEVTSRSHDPTSRWCDVCTLSISEDSVYYRCGICNGGDFDICSECYEIGGRCLQPDHASTLVKV